MRNIRFTEKCESAKFPGESSFRLNYALRVRGEIVWRKVVWLNQLMGKALIAITRKLFKLYTFLINWNRFLIISVRFVCWYTRNIQFLFKYYRERERGRFLVISIRFFQTSRNYLIRPEGVFFFASSRLFLRAAKMIKMEYCVTFTHYCVAIALATRSS